MESILRSLLDDLERVANTHEEIYDTDVREQIWEAVRHGFIDAEAGYRLPAEFGMFSPEGNRAVRAALESFTKKVVAAARIAGLSTPAERKRAFQNPRILSTEQHQSYDAFFGFEE